MTEEEKTENQVLSSVFSDETPLFRTPAEPEAGDLVTVRLRIARGTECWVTLLLPSGTVPMELCHTDALFDWYEASFDCPDRMTFYSFLIEWHDRYIHYRRSGGRISDSVPAPDPAHAFRILPGFHVPRWARGAVQYQIFVDRFRNGDSANDVLDCEYYYAGDHVHHAASWDALPEDGDFRCFYGGDLLGVQEKLDYLQSLGVEAIYFNPIFISPSSHKYDSQDYRHVDPHFTVIPKDMGSVLQPGDKQNIHAFRYIQRVTNEANLAESDAWFARFCQELHRRGMRIILDGVFNHCGSFHRWMDKEGIYLRTSGHRPGAADDPRSPYRSYFNFYNQREYEGWWGFDTLPKLNYEGSRELYEDILSIAEKWASPPYSIDGWRLDVGADLGHSREFNHLFWQEFRRRVKAVNPQLLIVAEHYGDPSEWLRGDEWDSVMNYDAFMEPVTFFLTGMEKHSDSRRDDLYQNGTAFFDIMAETGSHLPTPSLLCAMNELSNHDHSRFLTRTNGRVGRVGTAGSAAAGENVDKRVYQEAAVIQMTWPGAPTIYYGDEAGQVGWTDPDNRRTYPWGAEDKDLIAFHVALADLRRRFPVLRSGSLKPLGAGEGWIAYARFDARACAVIVVNNLEQKQYVSLRVADVGIPDDTRLLKSFRTTDKGHDAVPTLTGTVKNGMLHLRLAARSAMVLNCRLPEDKAFFPEE